MESPRSRPNKFLHLASQKSRLLAGLIIILFLISGILTIHDYGLTWDEGLGNMFFGERYFRYFTSFNPKYLDFKADLISLSNYPLHLYLSPFRDRPNEFPPFADTLSAASMYLFSYGLKWVNPVDGFHLFTVLLAAIFLWLVYRFAEPRLGRFAALMAILFIGTFPRFWADMHFNVKDVPETIFFSLVVMSYWSWYEKPASKKAFGIGILIGCALSIKANAIFILPILLLSILPWSFRLEKIRDFLIHFQKYWWHYAIMGISSISMYLLSWPYLYSDTFARLKSHWLYIYTQGGRTSDQWSIDPLRQALTTMPELMLIAGVIGIAFVLRQVFQDKSPLWRLLLLWIIIPILRTSIPGAVNFDGIRHFLEFLPALAMVAGYGVSQLASLMTQKWRFPKLIPQAGIVILLVINLVQINLHYYPYLHLYYNQFIGGLSGARDKFLGTEASDYWASSYRQGMEWLDQNAPLNSSIYALIAPWIIDLSGPVLLRPDIRIVSTLPDFSIMDQAPEPYYLMFIQREGGEAQDEIDYTKQHAKLAYQIVVDQVTILYIYQFGGR